MKTTETLNAETSPFSAEDYVQMACQLRRSAEMRIRYPDATCGGIIVKNGELWHAWDNLGGGNEAFLRMVGRANVTRIWQVAEGDVTCRTITVSCQKLLLEALITHDAKVNELKNSPALQKQTPDPALDSELTRPNWPALSNWPALHRASSSQDDEPVTVRSSVNAIAELRVALVSKIRTLAYLFRRPQNVQRAAAAAFGIVLLVSVAQILALPAGARDDTSATFSGDSRAVPSAHGRNSSVPPADLSVAPAEKLSTVISTQPAD